MYIKSKKYLKNRLNEFVSVSDLDISDLKDNLLPIIKGVDTYCWSYIKKRERNSSRVVSISLNTDSEFQRLFDAVKEANSVWKIYKYVPSTDLEVCFDYFDIQRLTDFKQLLEDPECRDIIENEANVKFIFNSDRKTDLHLLAKERRRFRREQEKVNDIYSYFNYTWDENEALAAVTNKRHVWVVRTNEYPTLPALFFYPKTPINSKDEEELISKYSHKLATAYKYELRDPSVNAYWLARPCRYPWFKEHPMPDGSELIIKINESKNKLTNMNTLSRDRNTLKRLVESYGKNDVLNFVRRLNESADNNFPYDELRRLTPITYEEAEDYLYNNWVYESGENIPGYPLSKDVNKLLNGLESCRRILYGYTAEYTGAFEEYFVEHPKYTYDLANPIVSYDFESDGGLMYDASKIETPEFIVIYFGDNCGDDSSQIIIGVK